MSQKIDPLLSKAISRARDRLSKAKVDSFELFALRKASTQIDSKNFKVDSLSRAEDVGLSVRLIKNQRVGFSFTTSLDENSIDQAVLSAHEIASLMPINEWANFASFGNLAYSAFEVYDAAGLATKIQQKIDIARLIESECLKADERVKAVRSASFKEVDLQVLMSDFQGTEIQYQKSIFTASVTCKAEQDGENQMGGEFGFAHELSRLDPSSVGRDAAKWATELLGAKVPKTTRCPGIIRSNVVADLLEFMSSSFSAEEIDKGRSILAEKQGQKIFSDQVTLIDDGLLASGLSNRPFDGEGIPSRRTTLIDNGYFRTALYDLYFAKKYNKQLTGNSSRGTQTPPSIAPSNLYLEPGDSPLSALIAGIKYGILITDLMGVHTANPVTGDFSLGASGILIENGTLTTPLKGFAVAGNVLKLFQDLQKIGSDLRFFGSLGAPSIQITELFVSGT